MLWIATLLLQFAFFYSGYRCAKRLGLWSWSKFFFLIAFLAVEAIILVLPLVFINPHTRYFAPAIVLAGLVFLANMAWVIRSARHWKFPGAA